MTRPPDSRTCRSDRTKWKDPWFTRFDASLKLIWGYIWDHCDHAGVWVPDLDTAFAECGFWKLKHPPKLGWKQDVFNVFNSVVRPADFYDDPPEPNSRHLEFLPNGRIWITNYIKVQTGLPLNTKCGHAQAIIRSLHANNIVDLFLQYYPNGIDDSAGNMEVIRKRKKMSVPKKRFPTLKDVKAWPEAAGVDEDALKLFHAHYKALGWKKPDGSGYYENYQALLPKYLGMESVLDIKGRYQALSEDELRERIAKVTEQIRVCNQRRVEIKPGVTIISPEAKEQARKLKQDLFFCEEELKERNEKENNEEEAGHD